MQKVNWKFLTVVVTLAAGGLVAERAAERLNAQAQSTPDPNWERRVPGARNYESVFEVSGRAELGMYYVSPDPQDMDSICAASRESEQLARKSAQRQAAGQRNAHGSDPLDRAWAEWSIGQLFSYDGEMARAAEHFEAAYRNVDALPATNAMFERVKSNLVQALGIAHLRRGELDNCVLDHNSDRCIFPIRGSGVHRDRSGSERAVEYLSKALARDPDNLEVRWLLNIAYMTLGWYPDRVPPAVLIPRARFEGAADAPPQPRFTDVAMENGVHLRSGAGGTVVDDLDNDGDLDIVMSSVGRCEPLRIYLNRGKGEFEDVSERTNVLRQLGGLNLTHADYDNDGRLDLFVHRGGWEAPMRNSLLRNNPDGTFTDATAGAGLLGRRAHRTHSAAWADYDNDGWLDLFIGNEESPSELFHNERDGTFREVGAAAGVARVAFTKGATWGDYDNDGHPDLYVSNYAGRNFLYHNRGDGTFEETAQKLGVDLPFMSFPTWFFDYDNDGWLDLFVANFVPSVDEVVRGYIGLPPQAETMRLYRNNARGGFEHATEAVGLDRVTMAMGANFGDIDNDGFPDIYLGTGAPSYAALVPNVLYRNQAGERFVDVTGPSGTGHLQKGHGVAFGDLDRDGHDELIVNNGGFVPGDAYWKSVFRNPGSDNNWITVKLVGSRSNRFGVGARITVIARQDDGTVLQRHALVTSGGSFGSSPYAQHIGLAKARHIERLEVWWPASGIRQTLRDVEIGTTVAVHESAPPVARVATR